MNKIGHLSPGKLWNYFYLLSQIPRPSKKEEKAVEFVQQFGEKLGLETKTDSVGNVLIKKPATQGYEDKKCIVFQGHLDMVPQKNSDKVHNFETDPIEAFIEDGWVTANGTTLGADNGIGVATMMAILESDDIEHGPIEALFTIDEETGLTGAFALQEGFVSGEILINLDSEDEGELYTGCAGGINATATFNYVPEPVPANYSSISITLSGLKGGHSGIDISKNRGNTNLLLMRLIASLCLNYDARVCSLDCGGLRNAIPREAECVLFVPDKKISVIEEQIGIFEETIKNEYFITEPHIKLTTEPIKYSGPCIDKKTQDSFIQAVLLCPNGVIRMDQSIEGLVETSSNLSRIQTKNNTIHVNSLIRSSVDSQMNDVSDKFKYLFTLAGAKVEFSGGYPGWKPNPDSPILNTMSKVYENLYNVTPKVTAIHAGLECGIIGSKYPNLDMISIGPTLRFPHSPDEKVEIKSVEKYWDFILETLKSI